MGYFSQILIRPDPDFNFSFKAVSVSDLTTPTFFRADEEKNIQMYLFNK